MELALWRVSGEFYAVSAKCPHLGGPMAEGKVLDMRLLPDVEDTATEKKKTTTKTTAMGPLISCPWHFFTFDMQRGNCVTTSCGALDVHAALVILGSVYVSLAPTVTGGVPIGRREKGGGDDDDNVATDDFAKGDSNGSCGGDEKGGGGGDVSRGVMKRPAPPAVVDFAPDGSMRRVG